MNVERYTFNCAAEVTASCCDGVPYLRAYRVHRVKQILVELCDHNYCRSARGFCAVVCHACFDEHELGEPDERELDRARQGYALLVQKRPITV